MSVRISSWVWHHSPVEHRGDLLVLLALADHTQDDGSGAYPSISTLARKARLSRRGVFDALKRLKDCGAIVAEGYGPHGTVSYRIQTEGVQPSHGAAVAPVQSPAPGGAVSDPGGVQPPAPEPSFKTSENRPGTRAGARGATPLVGDLADRIVGVLQRGIDGLTSDAPARPPTRQRIVGVLNRLSPTEEVAWAVAIETRSIVQSHNRAPNICALYEQKLERHIAYEAGAA